MSRKIISLGDYLEKKDVIHDIPVSDPDTENTGEETYIRLRIKKPTPKEALAIMELVNNNYGNIDTEKLNSESFETMTVSERNLYIRLSYEYDATLIACSVFLPPENDDLSLDSEQVFKNADDVMNRCPNELYDKLRDIVGQNKVIMSRAEGKK